MNIDDLLSGLHQDKVRTVEERLAAIELELNRRRLIGAEANLRLWEQLQVLTEEINRLLPEGPHAADTHRNDRAGLEKERRDLERDLSDQQAHRWRDEQALRREQRELQQMRTEQWQRYERHMKDYA